MALKSVPFPASKKKTQKRVAKKKAQSIAANSPRSADFGDLKKKVSKKTLNPSIKISSTIMGLSTVKKGRKVFTANPFAPARHPSSVAPKEVVAAMDAATAPDINWAAASNSVAGAITEGLVFLGYAYLAELAQRAEYRRIVERLATEMTRKWIRITSTTTDGADNTDKIKKINEDFDRLQVRDRFKESAEHDGYFGRGHIYIDFGNTDDSAELMTPIGDGKNGISKSKVGKERPIVRLKNVEPVWVYPVNYNSDDPLATDWYKPNVWYVQKRAVHASRLLTFVGREVPDVLKPAYSFGGLPLTQMAKPYVDNWLRTRQSVSDLVHSFSTSGIKTNLASLLSAGGTELFDRADFFNNMRDNRGLQLLDKDTEEFFNVSTPLGTLDKLQAQSQEQMASVCGIPIVILLGITPAGLNASSEGELQAFYEWVLAYQQALFAPNLLRLLNFVQLSLFGEIDPAIGFQFEPLQQLTKKELAEVRKLEAETDVILVDGQILSPMEARERIASDPESAYSGIEASDVPEPVAEEDGANDPSDNKEEEAAIDGVLPFVADDEAKFNEADHPRAENGEFGSGGGIKEAVSSYINPSDDSHAIKLNAKLRSDSVVSGKDKQIIDSIDSAIRSSKPFEKTRTLYRGLNESDAKFKKDDRVWDKAFISTSSERDSAMAYAAGSGKGVLYEIECPPGTKALSTAEYDDYFGGGEEEEILPRGSRFLVRGSRQEGNVKVVKLALFDVYPSKVKSANEDEK